MRRPSKKFTIRTLLIGTTVTAVAFGWAASIHRRWREKPRSGITEIVPIWYTGAYVQCDEADADFAIDISFTSPGYTERFPFKIPVCAAEHYEYDGILRPHYFCAAGSGGGISGKTGIESSTVKRICVRLDLLLSNGDSQLDVYEIVPIDVQKPDGEYSANDCIVEWTIEAIVH